MALCEHRTSNLRRCALCTDVVGVYEPAVFVLVDGSVVNASLLTVVRGGEIIEAYHLGCSPAQSGDA